MAEALRQIACTSSAGIDTQYSVIGSVNKSPVEYYHDGLVKMKKKEKVSIKKKLKLLKGLSKDLSTFSEMGFDFDQDQNLLAQVRGKVIKETAEVLMKQLEHLKAEEKELKRKRKQEKAKLKGKRSLSCESDSSDSDCEEEIIQAKGLVTEPVLREESLQNVGTSCLSDGLTKRVEVCMGNKCKRSGGGALLEEFQRVMGAEGDVVGCKCMGKCRDGPNVRLFNSAVHQQKPARANPLCIGVGLEDVGAIVGNFFTQDGKDLELGLSPAS